LLLSHKRNINILPFVDKDKNKAELQKREIQQKILVENIEDILGQPPIPEPAKSNFSYNNYRYRLSAEGTKYHSRNHIIPPYSWWIADPGAGLLRLDAALERNL